MSITIHNSLTINFFSSPTFSALSALCCCCLIIISIVSSVEAASHGRSTPVYSVVCSSGSQLAEISSLLVLCAVVCWLSMDYCNKNTNFSRSSRRWRRRERTEQRNRNHFTELFSHWPNGKYYVYFIVWFYAAARAIVVTTDDMS